MSKPRPHQNLTPEEQNVIWDRLKENPRDSWKPIGARAPRYSKFETNEWWYRTKRGQRPEAG